MTEERVYRPISGWVALVGCLIAVATAISLIVFLATRQSVTPALLLLVIPLIVSMFIGTLVTLCGFQAVAPNDSRAMLLFGEYRGSVVESGFYWVNPFYTKKRISLRVRNFETGTMSTPEKKDATGKIVQFKSRTSSRLRR